MTVLLCSVFFISGAAALIFETLWFRQAGLAFGNSVWASSLVLAGFMGGLALGNALAARYGDRLRNPVRAYALAEAAIGVTGLGLVYLLPVFGAVLAPWFRPLMDQPWVLNPLRLSAAFLLLLIPTTAMGITLPLLTKTLTGYDPHFGAVLGRLYGWNTLGAVCGVVSALYFIRVIGVNWTGLTAGALNLLVAAVAGWFSTLPFHKALMPSRRKDRPVLIWMTGRQWLIAGFLSGFCLLALEVVWFRFLLLFVFGSMVAFGLMLAVVLAGIALGGLSAAQWLRRRPTASRISALIAMMAGLACIGSYAVFPLVIRPLESHGIDQPIEMLYVSLPLMFPVSFLSGIFFTLIGSALREHMASDAETTGALTLVNTIGAALGSLTGGFLLLPVLGMEKSFFFISVLYGVIGGLLFLGSPVPRRKASLSLAIYFVGVALFPFGSMETRLLEVPVLRAFHANSAVRVAGVREGLTETIIYTETQMLKRPLYYTMLTNDHAMSGTELSARRYMKLFVYWPMAVHPHLKHALLIAYGVGNTAKAMTDSKSLETIDVVDLSRDVLEMNRIVYPRPTDLPLHDPRVHVHIEDGRYFLQTTDQRFDLITSEPPPPGYAGVENLYTREYFQLIHDRLAEGGMVTYWLPLHSLRDISTKAILRGFCDVFEDCSLWNGMGSSLMMVGTRGARGPVTEEQFTQQWRDPIVAGEMERLGFERPEQLGALFIGDADYLKGIYTNSPPLVDDYPRRIEAVLGSQSEMDRLYRSFTDVAAARTRFQTSPLTTRLWPERLREASLPYFQFQGIINIHGWNTKTPQQPDIEDIHTLLTQTTLTEPVLWLLGSDADIQGLLAGADQSELVQPRVQYHLGVHDVAEHKYLEAIEPLRRSEVAPEHRAQAFRLRIYALCMAGQTKQAQQLVQERLSQVMNAEGVRAGALNEAALPPFWSWMKTTFGIKPLAGI